VLKDASSNPWYQAWIVVWAVFLLVALTFGASTMAGSTPGTPALPFRFSDRSAPAPVVEISGFQVRALSASSDGLQVTVQVAVEGKPEQDGRLHFVPGPTLVWPDGAESRLASGATDGRTITLSFERPSSTPITPNAKMTMRIAGILGEAPQVSDRVVEPPANLLVAVDVVPDVTVSNVKSRVAVGNGWVVLDELWTTDSGTRLVGHFEGFSEQGLRNVTFSEVVLESNGNPVPAARWRAGSGAEHTGFALTFASPATAPHRLHFTLGARAGADGAIAPDVAHLSDAAIAISVNLED